MTIYDRIKDDHGKQRGLSAGLAETSGNSQERRRLFTSLEKELESHAAVEEKTFYKELLNYDDGQEQARHSVSEHKEAADLLEELRDTDMSSNAWLMTFKKLKEELEHHMDEEEEEVFPLARNLIDKRRAAELGDAFAEMKEEKMET